jgi:hypothetical protein
VLDHRLWGRPAVGVLDVLDLGKTSAATCENGSPSWKRSLTRQYPRYPPDPAMGHLASRSAAAFTGHTRRRQGRRLARKAAAPDAANPPHPLSSSTPWRRVSTSCVQVVDAGILQGLTCPPRCCPHGWPSLRAADRAQPRAGPARHRIAGPAVAAAGGAGRQGAAADRPGGPHRRRRGPAVRGRRPGRARISWFLVRAPARPRLGSRTSSALPAAVFFPPCPRANELDASG